MNNSFETTLTSSPTRTTAASPIDLPAAVSNPQPLRVLHIISDLYLAGAEMKLYKLLVATNREHITPLVITMRDEGALCPPIRALGVPVYALGIRGPIPGPVAIARLVRIVRDSRPDLIHGWMYHGNLAAQFAAACSGNNPSVVWSIHQSFYSFAIEKLLTAAVIKFGARLSRLPGRIIYVSKASAVQHQGVGYDSSKTRVIHYGFDTERFAPSQEARRSLREELRLSENAVLVGLIGRYHLVKDHPNFLRAAALIVKTEPEARFLLCGKGVSNRNPALRALIDEHRLGERVYLMGERVDIPRLTAALDIAVSSSFTEGFPSVVGEAMSCGVPCVVTDVSDLHEILGNTGRVVPPKDSPSLAEAITELIGMGSFDRQRLGARARARIIEHYSIESSVACYETIYHEVAAARQERSPLAGDTDMVTCSR